VVALLDHAREPRELAHALLAVPHVQHLPPGGPSQLAISGIGDQGAGSP
jgi:hypothetical protein